jgi:PAS domain S-box-containing protein
MTEQALATEEAHFDFLPSLSWDSGSYDVPFEELDPISARQAVLASLGLRSISASDISALALAAAKQAAKTCEVDGFSVVEKLPNNEGLLVRFSRLDPEAKLTTNIEQHWESSEQESLSAYTLSVGRSVVIADLHTDTRCEDPFLSDHQVTSAMVSPLMHPDGPLGTLGIYSTKVHEFDLADVFFLESIANLVAISYARHSAEEMVAVQSKRLQALLESSDTPSLELMPDGRITDCNSALERIAGFQLKEIKDRSIYSAFILPEELEEVRAALTAAQRNQQCARKECFLLTKSGARRRMIWSFTCVVDDDVVTSLIGTGVDITAQYELNERVMRAEAMADNAVQSLRTWRAKAAEKNRKDGRPSAQVEQDRRRMKRRPFPYKQILAPMISGQIPSSDMFREMRCRDLSSQGFSYFTPNIPDYQQLIVAFGKQGNLIHLTAEIVHVSPSTVDGKDVFVVGCRYTGRTVLEETGVLESQAAAGDSSRL